MLSTTCRRRRLRDAATPVQHLEKRALLHGAVDVAIDFQPEWATTAEGYFADVGRPYGDRTDGMAYGWSRDAGPWLNTWVSELHHPASLSQEGDTLIAAGWADDLRWEIALPAGRYRVTLLAGDATAPVGERYIAAAEGQVFLDFTITQSQKLTYATIDVDVLDGRLTLTAPDGLADTKFAAVRITAIHDENGGGSGGGGDTGGGIDGGLDDGGGSANLTSGEGTLIDFEELSPGAIGNVYEHASGHRFVSLPGRGGSTTETLWIRDGAQQYASKVLHPTNYARKIVLDRTDGASFSLASFEYAAGRWNEPGDAIVTGYFADGTTQAITVSFINRSLTPVTVNWEGLSRVEINYFGGVNDAYGALDDFLVGTTGSGDGGGGGGDGGDGGSGGGGGGGGTTDALVTFESAVGPIMSGIYSESGFTFTNLPGRGGTGTQAFQVYGGAQGYASKVLQPSNWARRIDVTRTDGAAFDFAGFDYAAGRWNEAGDLILTGTFAGGGTETMTVPYTNRQLKTLDVNWTSLESLSINFAYGVNDAYGVIDNLRFTTADDGDGDGGDGGGDDGGGVTLGSWTIHGNMPVPMMEGGVAVLNGNVYLWGGFDSGWTWLSRTHGYRFNSANGTWTRVADLPAPITHGQAIAHNGKIYLLGGYANNGDFLGNTDKVWVYDPATNKFSQWGTLPYAISGHGAVKDGSRVHLLGGHFRDSSNKFLGNSVRHVSIDLDNPAAGWRNEPDVPAGRDHVAAELVDGKIYYFAGQMNDDEYTGVRSELWRYDLATKLWSSGAAMPDGGRGHVDQATVVYNGKIITVAGNINGKVLENYSDEVFMYDPAADTWSLLGTVPDWRRGSHVALINDTLWVFGGGTSYPHANVWSAKLITV